MPVRVAGPSGVSGLTDHLLTPAFSTSLGLLMWGAQAVHGYEPPHYESAPAPRCSTACASGRAACCPGGHPRISLAYAWGASYPRQPSSPAPTTRAERSRPVPVRAARSTLASVRRRAVSDLSKDAQGAYLARPEAAQGACPACGLRSARARHAGYARLMRSTALTVHTASRRGLFDITPSCARVRRPAQGDGLLNVFVPHATAGRRGHGARRRLRRGPDGGARPPAAARRSLAPQPRLARPRSGPRPAAARRRPRSACPVVDGRLQLGTWQSIALLDPNPDNSAAARLAVASSAAERAYPQSVHSSDSNRSEIWRSGTRLRTVSGRRPAAILGRTRRLRRRAAAQPLSG